MDLHDAVAILLRRWPIIAAVTILALVFATAFSLRGPRAYEASMRLAVSVTDEGSATSESDAPPYSYYRDYYLWLSSEYLADDLAQLLKSQSFGTDVGQQLGEDARTLDLSSLTTTKKTHRMLDVAVQAPSPTRALQLASAIAELVRTQSPRYLSALASSGGRVAVIDQPSVHAATTVGSQVADVGLRGLLGLLAGLFLAFVVDYVDSTIRDAGDVRRALGLPVLGEIPAGPRP
jgi:non-specific protein-tyrosine kinase